MTSRWKAAEYFILDFAQLLSVGKELAQIQIMVMMLMLTIIIISVISVSSDA